MSDQLNRLAYWRVFIVVSFVLVGLCVLFSLLSGVTMAQDNCQELYDPGNGWVVEMCAADPVIATPMAITLNGSARGEAALVRIYHKSQNYPGTPQVAVIYASGYIRLKQNADPAPPVPFGSSFVLGPAYWPDAVTYRHNPQLEQLNIDSDWLPNGPLRMQIEGTNGAFDVAYELTMPQPSDLQTRLHVTQIYSATNNVTIAPARRADAEGFKLVQVSSMYINEGGICDGGHSDCHDSDGVRFIGDDLTRHQAAFADHSPSTFVLSPTIPLGSVWFDTLHSDDQSWQGNTPTVRIVLDELPDGHTITPQGWISPTTNPNDDNVGFWLHDDGPASESWVTGQSASVGYWLMAQDNPPEPWVDHDLRPGQTFQDFEGSYDCFFVRNIAQTTSGAVTAINGYSDTALQLSYDIGGADGNWAQIRCDFDPPLDLSGYDHLRFDWRGDPLAANSLEIGLINPGAKEKIFARGYHHASQRGWWNQLVIPFMFLHPWTDGSNFDPSQISALFVSVVKDPKDDVGGLGSLAIDNLSAYNVVSREVPEAFEDVGENDMARATAVDWLKAQQQVSGLLKSWEEEPACIAHTYDQALALIAFARERRWKEADMLVEALTTTQNGDGSWFKSRNCLTLAPIHDQKWEGDIAWAVMALNQYISLGGSHPQASPIRDRAANWLVTRTNSADGCLVIDHTEATIDVWWALQTSGPTYADETAGLENCLLTEYWDEEMGRFKGGKSWWQPYLDNQTWGAAFLRNIGKEEDARRALSYAQEVMVTPAQGGQLFGFDGQAGPWSLWNEGSGQYVAMGGGGANNFLMELLAQQRPDGAMASSQDEFNGGGVWTTRWHGVAPTAWLTFALTSDPFQFNTLTYLPLVVSRP